MKLHEHIENVSSGFSFKPSDIGYNYYAVGQSDIFSHWKTIQTELDRALLFSPEDSICSGDVYVALTTNKDNQLYLVESFKGEYKGFFIVQIVQERTFRKCHIWLAGFKENGIFWESAKMVLNIARHNKCSKITCSSTRNGMAQAMSQFGMKQKYIAYEMEI